MISIEREDLERLVRLAHTNKASRHSFEWRCNCGAKGEQEPSSHYGGHSYHVQSKIARALNGDLT